MHKYHVYIALLNASCMRLEDNDPIEINVSMGLYGDMMEDSMPPATSTTAPLWPQQCFATSGDASSVFGATGTRFFFLPWNESRSCNLLEVQFERTSFRLEALNLLLGLKSKLVRSHRHRLFSCFLSCNVAHVILLDGMPQENDLTTIKAAITARDRAELASKVRAELQEDNQSKVRVLS